MAFWDWFFFIVLVLLAVVGLWLGNILLLAFVFIVVFSWLNKSVSILLSCLKNLRALARPRGSVFRRSGEYNLWLKKSVKSV